MDELLPVVLGVCARGLVPGRGVRRRALAATLLAVAGGAAVAVLSGEAAANRWSGPLDATTALAGFGAADGVAGHLARRRRPRVVRAANAEA